MRATYSKDFTKLYNFFSRVYFEAQKPHTDTFSLSCPIVTFRNIISEPLCPSAQPEETPYMLGYSLAFDLLITLKGFQ